MKHLIWSQQYNVNIHTNINMNTYMNIHGNNIMRFRCIRLTWLGIFIWIKDSNEDSFEYSHQWLNGSSDEVNEHYYE